MKGKIIEELKTCKIEMRIETGESNDNF